MERRDDRLGWRNLLATRLGEHIQFWRRAHKVTERRDDRLGWQSLLTTPRGEHTQFPRRTRRVTERRDDRLGWRSLLATRRGTYNRTFELLVKFNLKGRKHYLIYIWGRELGLHTSRVEPKLAQLELKLKPNSLTQGQNSERVQSMLNRRLLEAVNPTGKLYMTRPVAAGAYMLRFAIGATLAEERGVRAGWTVIQEQARLLLSKKPQLL
ncbi:Tyrosine/DOPA decarboxylase 1 [Nymphaea thermarum]|nr:Tyrosine/DOPA decarboxylase 1 [Nymphaea thermarum]